MNFNKPIAKIGTFLSNYGKHTMQRKGRVIAGSLAGAGIGAVAGGEDHRISGGLKGAIGGAFIGRSAIGAWVKGASITGVSRTIVDDMFHADRGSVANIVAGLKESKSYLAGRMSRRGQAAARLGKRWFGGE
jgi:hypothetical protein